MKNIVASPGKAIRRLRRGDAITAAWLNEIVDAVNAARSAFPLSAREAARRASADAESALPWAMTASSRLEDDGTWTLEVRCTGGHVSSPGMDPSSSTVQDAFVEIADAASWAEDGPDGRRRHGNLTLVVKKLYAFFDTVYLDRPETTSERISSEGDPEIVGTVPGVAVDYCFMETVTETGEKKRGGFISIFETKTLKKITEKAELSEKDSALGIPGYFWLRSGITLASIEIGVSRETTPPTVVIFPAERRLRSDVVRLYALRGRAI